MAIVAAVGRAKIIEAREAGMQAAYQALNKLGTVSPTLALVIVPYRYDPQQVINGVVSMLSNVPTLGFSVSSGLTSEGAHSHSVVVGLLGGDDFQAETHWFPSYQQSGADVAMKISELLGYEQSPVEQVLVFAGGMNAGVEDFCARLPAGLPVFGGLSSGDVLSGGGFQIAGVQSGISGLAGAFLRGKFKLGVGVGHGWRPVGIHFEVTSVDGPLLHSLDGQACNAVYSNVFGQSANSWCTPPLNTLCRLYPLGFNQPYTDELLVRAPVRMETSGDLLMNANLPVGSDAYLLVGSPEECLSAARKAAQDAMAQLDGAKPVFSLVLVDVAWQMLMQGQSGREIKVIAEVLGADVPLAGGYTLGQILQPENRTSQPRYLNQHIVVAVFSESRPVAGNE
jgi:hypothetical protein